MLINAKYQQGCKRGQEIPEEFPNICIVQHSLNSTFKVTIFTGYRIEINEDLTLASSNDSIGKPRPKLSDIFSTIKFTCARQVAVAEYGS